MKKIRPRWQAAAVLAALFLPISAEYSVAQEALADEPIAFVGHGAMFDQAGNEIPKTRKFIAQAQAWYLRELTARLSAEQRKSYEDFSRQAADGLSLDEQSQLILNSSLIDWLLDQVQLREGDRIRSKNNVLKRILKRPVSDVSDSKMRKAGNYQPHPDLLDKLAQARAASTPAKAKMFALTDKGGAEYRSECANNGVPIPPDFGPNSAWVSHGIIPAFELFIERDKAAEVFTYNSSSPPGMCVALPRFRADDMVELDGVICLGQQSSKVCFWDNEKNGQIFEFPRGSQKAFSDFGGGTELRATTGGVCSDCHAGENPYIIHGKILNGLGANLPTFGDDFYKPLVRTGDSVPWPENPGPLDLSAPARCTGCHGPVLDAGRFPMLSTKLRGYCGVVLRSSLGALAPPAIGDPLNPAPTMPPGKAAGTLACTPGLQQVDPRYRPCSAETTKNCTPSFATNDPRRQDKDFPSAYNVSCTSEVADLLALCNRTLSN